MLKTAALAAVSVILLSTFAIARPLAQAPAPQGGRAGQPGRGAPDPAAVARAETILADARKALGGEKLVAVRSVLATGHAKRVRGNNLVPIEFEIAIELPDKYVRKDEIPAEESEPTSTGFVGSELIQLPLAAAPARAGAAPPTPAQVEAQNRSRVLAIKQDFTRLTLGMFAGPLPAAPLTFAFAGVAEAPQGTADVIDVRGDGNLSLRLYIHHTTHLPIMVSWQGPPTGVVVTVPNQPVAGSVAPGSVIVTGPMPPAATASQEEKDKYVKDVADLRRKMQTTPVEHRLYYADYRDVDGVRWPFRLRRAIGPDTSEETTFDRFKVNVKIDPRKFTR